MPDASSKLIPADYEEPELPGGDGRRWEEEKLGSAVFHYGAKDAKVLTADIMNLKYDFIERGRFGSFA